MKRFKKLTSIALVAVMALTLGTTAAFAATNALAISTPSAQSEKTGQPPREQGAGKQGKGLGVNVLTVAATVLGKTEDEIKEAVKAGKVGDLLIAAGKVDDFKAAYLVKAQETFSAAVAAGTLTQAQADERYAAEKTKMDAYDGTTHLCGGTDHSKMFAHKDGAKGEHKDSASDAAA